MIPRLDVALQTYNTLAVPSTATHFYQARTVSETAASLRWAKQAVKPVYVIGGGSNVVLAPRLEGLALLPKIEGRDIVRQDKAYVWVRFACGEIWHNIVEWSLRQGLYGLENLALIPGTVGAAPVQNIGAYGMELCDVFDSLQAIDRMTGRLRDFDQKSCRFAYRDSVFKSESKDRYIITHVTLRLLRTPRPKADYPALQAALASVERLTPKAVFDAVCRVRNSKLPDPAIMPNCGSFFKNPMVTVAKYEQLSALYPAMPYFNVPAARGVEPSVKLAAAWLIDQAGWKGQERYNVVVHPDQALVISNPRCCPADSVLMLADDIACSIKQRFGVLLELEPQLLGW